MLWPDPYRKNKAPGICRGCPHNRGAYGGDVDLADCDVYTPGFGRGITIADSYDCIFREKKNVAPVKKPPSNKSANPEDIDIKKLENSLRFTLMEISP